MRGSVAVPAIDAMDGQSVAFGLPASKLGGRGVRPDSMTIALDFNPMLLLVAAGVCRGGAVTLT